MDKIVKGIVLDLDGTLLDTEKMNIVPLQKLIKEELGQDIPYQDLLKYRAYAGKKTLELLGFSDIEKSYAKWVSYVNTCEEKAVLYDGWREVIETLSNQGYVCAIASSKLRDQYEIDFHPTGLKKYMKAVVLAEDTLEHKPHPAPLLKAAEIIKVPAENLIYVGDTIFDAEASKKAGMKFAFAMWGASDLSIEADYRLEKPTDLLKFVG